MPNTGFQLYQQAEASKKTIVPSNSRDVDTEMEDAKDAGARNWASVEKKLAVIAANNYEIPVPEKEEKWPRGMELQPPEFRAAWARQREKKARLAKLNSENALKAFPSTVPTTHHGTGSVSNIQSQTFGKVSSVNGFGGGFGGGLGRENVATNHANTGWQNAVPLKPHSQRPKDTVDFTRGAPLAKPVSSAFESRGEPASRSVAVARLVDIDSPPSSPHPGPSKSESDAAPSSVLRSSSALPSSPSPQVFIPPQIQLHAQPQQSLSQIVSVNKMAENYLPLTNFAFPFAPWCPLGFLATTKLAPKSPYQSQLSHNETRPCHSSCSVTHKLTCGHTIATAASQPEMCAGNCVGWFAGLAPWAEVSRQKMVASAYEASNARPDLASYKGFAMQRADLLSGDFHCQECVDEKTRNAELYAVNTGLKILSIAAASANQHASSSASVANTRPNLRAFIEEKAFGGVVVIVRNEQDAYVVQQLKERKYNEEIRVQNERKLEWVKQKRAERAERDRRRGRIGLTTGDGAGGYGHREMGEGHGHGQGPPRPLHHHHHHHHSSADRVPHAASSAHPTPYTPTANHMPASTLNPTNTTGLTLQRSLSYPSNTSMAPTSNAPFLAGKQPTLTAVITPLGIKTIPTATGNPAFDYSTVPKGPKALLNPGAKLSPNMNPQLRQSNAVSHSNPRVGSQVTYALDSHPERACAFNPPSGPRSHGRQHSFGPGPASGSGYASGSGSSSRTWPLQYRPTPDPKARLKDVERNIAALKQTIRVKGARVEKKREERGGVSKAAAVGKLVDLGEEDVEMGDDEMDDEDGGVALDGDWMEE